MKNSNKLAAFTILELMIALLISGIVITMVYYVLMLFNFQWINYQSKSSQRNEYQLLKKSLTQDIVNATLIVDSSDAGGLNIFGDGDSETYYQFGQLKSVRIKKDLIDTFFCGGAISGVQYLNDSLKVVKAFILNLNINSEVIPVLFSKEYTAKELMKATSNE